MKLTAMQTDNITEILMRIVEFTDRRREVLTRNLFDYQSDDFRPKDLAVSEFAECMTEAVSEHLHSRRLLMCDKQNVSFGEEGSFETYEVIDSESETLLRTNSKKYLQLQINKLSENLMNNRIAVELLKQKNHCCSF